METKAKKKLSLGIQIFIALALGIIAGRLLRGDPDVSVLFHKAAAALIALDLVIRVIPVRANIAFGLPYAIIGFAVRATCLYMVIRDLKVSRKTKSEE